MLQRITVRTLQYQYFARHPLEDFDFKHESKYRSYFPEDLLQVKHLRKKNGFKGNVVVLRALEGDEANEERRIDEQKEAAHNIRQVIELSEDEEDVETEAIVRHDVKDTSNHHEAQPGKQDEDGYLCTVSIRAESNRVSDEEEQRNDQINGQHSEHWEEHDENPSYAAVVASRDSEQGSASEDLPRAPKLKRSSSTPGARNSDNDADHKNSPPLGKRARLACDSPTAGSIHEARTMDDDMESRNISGSTTVDKHEQMISLMSTPHYTNDNFDREMELQRTSETLPTYDDFQEHTAKFLEPPQETPATSELQTCGVPSCQKHFYFNHWTEYGPHGDPLCALCSKVFVQKHGDEQGSKDFENLIKANFHMKSDRAQQGYPQNMDDDDAPLDHPALLGHGCRVNDDATNEGTEAQSLGHADLARPSREASVRSADSFRTAGETLGEHRIDDDNLVIDHSLNFTSSIGLPEIRMASSPYRSLSPIISFSDLLDQVGRSTHSPDPSYRGPRTSLNSIQSAASDTSPELGSSRLSSPFHATTRNNHSPTTFIAAVPAPPEYPGSTNNSNTATIVENESHASPLPWNTADAAGFSVDPAIFNATNIEEVSSEDTDIQNGFFGDSDYEDSTLTSFPTFTSINQPTAAHFTPNGRTANNLASTQPAAITSSTAEYANTSSDGDDEDDEEYGFDPDAFAAEAEDVEAARDGDADDDYTESESEADEDF